MSDFKEMTYEQKIGKAFFDLSQEISNTEIKKLRREVEKLKAENKELRQANGIPASDSGLHLQRVSESFLKSLVVENIVKSYGVDLMLVKELAAEIRKL